ncbi:MAG: hypothetical protein JXR25_11625 [Pontiellaceae bacterium]|nr:hypothetical protein [Pontiellaceae bacterium]MBN2785464.1 hypothetical protein [Pontiellaceae bacterium]
MTPFEIYFIAVFVINIALGLAVFATNHKRTANQLYLILSFIIALWLGSNWIILHTASIFTAKIFVQLATAVAIFIPASCHLLRLSILHPSDSWTSCLFRARKLLVLCLATSLICFSPYFISGVNLAPGSSGDAPIAEPDYGWAFFIFTTVFVGMVTSLLITFISDRKRLTGFPRIELEFITTGYSMALVLGTLCGLLVTLFTGSSQTVPMANATSILALTLIIAYGIATKRILGIATILRRFTAQVLLMAYLIALYVLVWQLALIIQKKIGFNSEIIAQLIATLSVAFTMAPVHGRLQKMSARLISARTMDIAGTMKRAGEIFQTVRTQTTLEASFSDLLSTSLGTEAISFYTRTEAVFNLSFSNSSLHSLPTINTSHKVIELILSTKDPICKDSLFRSRPNKTIRAAYEFLEENHISILIGIFSKSELTGLVAFGSRAGGRIYDKTEQDALQILCNQFAVALENAQLYTEMQDSKIRNEIMLDQLVSGVILANTARIITLFNHEAQRITGIHESDAMFQSIDVLPAPIRRALDHALQLEHGERNLDARLFEQEDEKESLNIRMGTTFLHGHDQKPMGALMVFTDMTELKTLEAQVRRADQLSSVGTLAAGMAHEIKNPLVTIKTFTQLLPHRFSDEDFRQDFSSLVAHEVERIDGIVNQLLSFSKPTKPHLVPMNLHPTLQQILKLTHEQMSQHNIIVKDQLTASTDNIMGDAKLLSQALINLTLNAVEAIGKNGTITIGTSNCIYHFANGGGTGKPVKKNCIRIQISDTGQGIKEESLQKIFDPFFTSKSEGTGMGLSVAHGIISEHHGVIEVESDIGKGTTFYLYIPLLDEEAL